MPPAASQILVMLETVILRIAADGLLRFNNEIDDLNSGQLVRVERTINPITPFGACECSAAKETTGSRKYPATVKTTAAGISQKFDLIVV